MTTTYRTLSFLFTLTLGLTILIPAMWPTLVLVEIATGVAGLVDISHAIRRTRRVRSDQVAAYVAEGVANPDIIDSLRRLQVAVDTLFSGLRSNRARLDDLKADTDTAPATSGTDRKLTCAECHATWPDNHAARCRYEEADSWTDLLDADAAA